MIGTKVSTTISFVFSLTDQLRKKEIKNKENVFCRNKKMKEFIYRLNWCRNKVVPCGTHVIKRTHFRKSEFIEIIIICIIIFNMYVDVLIT